ncbi:MAG: hypothetical protein Q8P67_23085 [archaeon]|nr:hypothetical protein [archaeon]
MSKEMMALMSQISGLDAQTQEGEAQLKRKSATCLELKDQIAAVLADCHRIDRETEAVQLALDQLAAEIRQLKLEYDRAIASTTNHSLMEQHDRLRCECVSRGAVKKRILLARLKSIQEEYQERQEKYFEAIVKELLFECEELSLSLFDP